MLDLTLSIVSHGHQVLLDRLLRRLDALHEDGLKVIVTLNKDGELFQSRQFLNLSLTVIKNKIPKGFGANHNSAFSHCVTKWFAVINPDIEIVSSPLPSLLRIATTDPWIGVLAPKVLDSEGRLQDSVRDTPTPLSIFSRLLGFASGRSSSIEAFSKDEYFWFAGMFLVFNSDAYRKIGGFDERFFLYYEDYDICARLREAGYKLILDDDASVIHNAQRSSHKSLRYLRWHAFSLFRVWTSPVFWRTVLRATGNNSSR